MIGRKSEIIRSFDHIEGFSVETEEKNYPGWDWDDALSTGDVFLRKMAASERCIVNAGDGW